MGILGLVGHDRNHKLYRTAKWSLEQGEVNFSCGLNIYAINDGSAGWPIQTTWCFSLALLISELYNLRVHCSCHTPSRTIQ